MRTEALNLELSRWARMNHSQTDRVHQWKLSFVSMI
jgi:hypothetical protein